MFKVRIIAILIALALTALTIYLIPIVVYHYKSFVGGLDGEQQIWFSWAQAFIGFSIAAYCFWRWKRKSK
jgi:hypothetical protein